MAKQKTEKNKLELIPNEAIISKIYFIRGKKVMFDRDLAVLYGVETKALNRAVKRNIERFPDDFMFQLNDKETDMFSRYQFGTLNEDENLRCQFGTSSYGGRRYRPYVFTEQGVAMLSSVLNSKRAIQVNIQIIRTFTRLREILITHKELREKIEKLEKKFSAKLSDHDKQFKIIFEAIKLLLKEDSKPKERIGFRVK